MILKRPLCPSQLRRMPPQFSWVDQRLVRERHIDRLSPQACALYLFLITVADAQGLSFYADRSVSQRLHLTPGELQQARRLLRQQGLIAYRAPLYQVLALEAPKLASASDATTRQDDLDPQEVKAVFERIWEALS